MAAHIENFPAAGSWLPTVPDRLHESLALLQILFFIMFPSMNGTLWQSQGTNSLHDANHQPANTRE